MEPLKPIDYKILFELMKDSHRSDREVGRAAGISQPIVTRRRNQLEKDIIYGYTALPKLIKLVGMLLQTKAYLFWTSH